MEEKKLFLIDGHAVLYRSYFAFINNPRVNSKGVNTSAVFGFVNTLYEMICSTRKAKRSATKCMTATKPIGRRLPRI